jgi:hypothetical protein
MQNLIQELKNIKNATKEQYDEIITKYAKEKVDKELKQSGLSIEDLSDKDYQELLDEEIKQAKQFSKGALAATGLFLFLELLG